MGGNVRELENVIHRFVVLSTAISEVSISDCFDSAIDVQNIPSGTLEEVELAIIRNRLDEHEGNKQRRAESLGISRFYLMEKINHKDVYDHFKVIEGMIR